MLNEIDQNFSDPSTERNINAVICQFGREVFEDIDDLVTPSTFTINHNQIVYKCIKHIYENSDRNEDIKIDNSLLLATAKTLGYKDFFTDPSEIKLIDRLFNMPVEPTNARKLAAYVRKLEIRRLIAKQLNLGLDDLLNVPNDTPIEELLAKIESRVLDFTSLINDDAKQVSEIGDGIDEYVQHVMDNPCEMMGISTGYPLYDKYVGGLRRGAIQLIAARAKAGKSMLSINIGMHIAGKLGIDVLYLDSEMSKTDNYSRMLANLAEVDIDDIETGKFARNKIKKAKVLAAKEKLKQMPFHYCSIAGKPTEEILAIIRKWVNRTVGFDENGNSNNCVVIYDYLKIMDAGEISKNMQEFMLLGYLVSSLNNLLVKLKIPCLAFAQMNRDGVTSESITSVASSDRISWFCSSVSAFRQKSEEDLEECGEKYGSRKLIPLIARYGESIGVGNYINMHFNGKQARIKEGKTYFEIKSSGDEPNDTEYISDNVSDSIIDETYQSPPWE